MIGLSWSSLLPSSLLSPSSLLFFLLSNRPRDGSPALAWECWDCRSESLYRVQSLLVPKSVRTQM